MAFNVRVTTYRGMREMRKVLPQQYAADSVQMLEEPYEWSQVLASNGATAVPSVADNTANVTMVKIEVADGQSIRYEVKPPGSTRSAGNASPRMSGTDFFPFAPGWTFEFVDAASYP